MLENAARAAAGAEDFTEEIERIVEPAARSTGSRTAALKGTVPVAVVGRALLLVHEDLIRLAELLETLFGLLVTRIFIRVKLHRQASVGFFDLVAVGVTLDLEDFVVVALGRHCPGAPLDTMTLAGRRRRRSLSM